MNQEALPSDLQVMADRIAGWERIPCAGCGADTNQLRTTSRAWDGIEFFCQECEA